MARKRLAPEVEGEVRLSAKHDRWLRRAARALSGAWGTKVTPGQVLERFIREHLDKWADEQLARSPDDPPAWMKRRRKKRSR
jgi:hypothetical protein